MITITCETEADRTRLPISAYDRADRVVIAGKTVKDRYATRLAFKPHYLDLVARGQMSKTVRPHIGDSRRFEGGQLIIATDGERDIPLTVTGVENVRLSHADLNGCPPDMRSAQAAALSLSNLYETEVGLLNMVQVVSFVKS